MAERMFPIQGDFGNPIQLSWGRLPDGQVPWKLAEMAYQVYSHLHGTSQSLERLAERRGFGWIELSILLVARRYPQEKWREIVNSLLHLYEVAGA